MTGIEMGHRHGRGSDGGLPVHFGVVTGRDVRPVTAKPQAAHREPAVTRGLRDPGFLQQVQRSAAGADEYETGLNVLVLAGSFIPDSHAPSIAIAAHVLDSGMKVH
jgi:hypothetical protein